jgi:hypothetical protein
MADPTIPKGQYYDDGTVSDAVTKETQKGYSNYDNENARAQKARDAEDQKFKDTVKSGVDRVKKAFGMKKGGKVSSASSRADGIAKRGKTRGTYIK